MSMLEHALSVAARGLPVFPCRRTNKAPYVGADLDENGNEIPKSGGFYKATTDVEQIREWWRKWPRAMIGVPMGKASGLFAVDCDRPKQPGDADGVEGFRALCTERSWKINTHTVITPRDGRHCIFRLPADRKIKNSVKSSNKSAPSLLAALGCDIRGEGGYVIWEGSVNADGATYEVEEALDANRFTDAPEELLDKIAPREPQERPQAAEVASFSRTPAAPVSGDRGRAYGLAALNGIAQDLAATPRMRNEAANKAAFKAGQLVGAGLVNAEEARERIAHAAVANGYVAKDGQAAALATIDSGLAAGVAQPRQIELRASVQPSRREAPKVEAANANEGEANEDSVAIEFARQFEGRLAFDHDAGKWLAFDGAAWRANKTQLAFHWARELARDLAADQSPGRRAPMAKASFAGSIERYARADPVFARTSEDWDQDPFLLGTPGGTVDLRPGQLREPDPADGITKLTAVAPAETADCPTWLRFLEETTGGDAELIRFMKQWLGYSLTGDTREHALVFVYGPGGNGKSVFVNVAAHVMGEHHITAPMEVLTASKNDRHPTELAMLRGARLVSANETEQDRGWAEARIKQLTGGDTISARFMYGNFFEFKNTAKLLVVGNHKPVLRNVDDAMRRRFLIVPFTRRPAVPDKDLEAKLIAEAPGILRWMIEGCLDWQANGLSRPASVLAATEEYFAEQDMLKQWIDEEIELDPENQYKWETSADLFTSWETFARRAGEEPGTRKGFGTLLKNRLGLTDTRKSGARIYLGVRIRRPQSRGGSDE